MISNKNVGMIYYYYTWIIINHNLFAIFKYGLTFQVLFIFILIV